MNKFFAAGAKTSRHVLYPKIEGDKSRQEGFCMKCALDLNLGPIKQMMQSMGISEDEVEGVSEQFDELFDEAAIFIRAGRGRFRSCRCRRSFRRTILPTTTGQRQNRKDEIKRNRRKGKKVLNLYCTDLTAKAKRASSTG